MAEGTLAERDDTFNASLSSLETNARLRANFKSSERVAQLEYVIMLLAQADALSTVALYDALTELSREERHHYLVALNDLIVASREQLEDVLSASRSKEEE